MPQPSPRSLLVLLAWTLCASALCGCASPPQTGIMAAQWTPPAGSSIPVQTVTIAWESPKPDTHTGEMTFTLGRGGERYVGSYLLIEKTVAHTEIEPLYDMWNSSSAAAWDAASAGVWFTPGWTLQTFVQHYDGRVVVGLHGDRDHSARCHFTLADTNVGIPGGGTGACQIDDGGHLKARF